MEEYLYRRIMAENVQDEPFSLEEKDIEEARKVVEEHGLENIVSHMQEKLTEIGNVTVNIAVAGVSGSGKSTFINTIRGIRAGDKDGADTGSVETTIEPTSYPFLTNANVKIWDLPGLGTPTITKQNYDEKVKLNRYDIFLVLTVNRFTDNDLWLAREVTRRGKEFFLVRTHTDKAVKDDKREYGEKSSESDVLAKIRENTKKHLEEAQIKMTRIVYVISALLDHTEKWDFKEVQKDMTMALNDTQRQVLSLAHCNLSADLIKEKCDVLRSRIWKIACVSGAIGALPIPIVDILASHSLLHTTVTSYKTYLGLDEASLRRLSKRTGVPYETLVSTADQYLNISLSTSSSALIKYYGVEAAETALSVGFHCIPILGASAAFGTTYVLLNTMLSDMEKVAIKVITTALK